MNYKQAKEYIEETAQYGSVLGLNNIKELLKRLGNPQDDLRFIHIAGTNGKGSVAALIDSVLQCAGYKTGKYISPTVFSYREKIQVDGNYIEKDRFGVLTEEIETAIRSMQEDNLPHPTMFEVETALAFLYFKECSCNIVVLETGLGGLLDATNVVNTTVLAVITSISMDHMVFLGDTLEKIAVNKAGIIKKQCRSVALLGEASVMKVLQSACKEKKSTLSIADPKLAFQVQYHAAEMKQSFSYKQYDNLKISLLGSYQIANSVLSVEAVEILKEEGFVITEEQLRKGLLAAKWQGRFSAVNKEPLFIIDGAHNEDAARKLTESIQFYFTNRKIIYIMGILKDKEIEKITEITAPFAAEIITVTTSDNNRGMKSLELAQIVKKYHSRVTSADSLEEAVEISLLLAEKDSVIVAFGSLSYLGDLVRIVKHKKNLKISLPHLQDC